MSGGGGWHALAVPAVASAAWGLCLLWCLTWLAARHWITAWLLACNLLAAAWGFILSLAFGPVGLTWGWDPSRWAGYARRDAALVVTWADPLKPWQLCAIIGGLGAWCKLVRVLHKRRDRRVIARAAPAQPAQQVPVVPVAWIGGPPK